MVIRFLIVLALFFSKFELNAQDLSDSLIYQNKLIIEFNSDEYNINESDKDQIKNFLSTDSMYYYRLKAHTDSDGSLEYNYKLSEKRNEEVRSFLSQLGVNEKRITSNYYGEDSLLVEEHNEAIKIKNRRVELNKFKKIQLIGLKGKVFNGNNNTGVESEIRISSPSIEISVKTDSSGAFQAKAPIDEELQIDVISKGFFIDSKRLKLNKNSKTDNMLFKLKEFKLHDKQSLENLNFEGNTHVLLQKSMPHLETLKQFMILNNETCIELAGHINMPNIPPLARHTESFGLSIARALVLSNRLEEIGISKDRMLARGYGNTYMLFPKAISQKEQSANRRVELIISDCDSTNLIKNDELKDLSIYDYNSPMDRKFNKTTLVRDLTNLPEELKRKIITVVKNLELNKKDPTAFTYKQLILKFKELKSSSEN